MLTVLAYGQEWGVLNHPNNRTKAIVVDSVQISEFVYTEISDLSEDKAYIAKGDLYAYINKKGKELTPYMFTMASNFTNGYALVGDSFNMSVLNEQMQLIVPFEYERAKLPVHGLICVQSFAGFWGIYDVKGDLKLPCIYDLPPQILSRDLIIVRKNEEYGVVNDCNEILYNCAYQYISADGLGYKQGKYLRLF
jgi:hypothetical protein